MTTWLTVTKPEGTAMLVAEFEQGKVEQVAGNCFECLFNGFTRRFSDLETAMIYAREFDHLGPIVADENLKIQRTK